MAIVTSSFRVSAASGFASTFATDNIYVVLGRPQPWDNALSTNFASQGVGTVSDNNPPNPIDNWQNGSAFWRDAMAAAKINYSNTNLVIPRVNWQYGLQYDMYSHDISNSNPTQSNAYDLDDSNFIVYVTSTGAVYKCLWNGRNGATSAIASTVMPTTTSAVPQQTLDGYIWKYLYTITSAQADFVTSSYIPVISYATSISNISGLDVIYLTNNGSSYTTIPQVTIYGDGIGATAYAVTSAGSITQIKVSSSGIGYTWAKIEITGGGTPTTANAIAVIAPAGGHGSNMVYETCAHNVMISGTIAGYYNSEFPVNQDFRTVGLVKNPNAYSTSYVTSVGTNYTNTTGRILRTLQMTSSATTAPANDILLVGSNSGAFGLMAFQSSGTVNLQYIQPVNSDVPANISDSYINPSTGQLKQFVNSESITGTAYSQFVSSVTAITPEIQPYSGQILYYDYRQPVTRSASQNEKINIVINF